MVEMTCVFCRIIDKQLPSQSIVEYEDCIVIKDRAPKADIHWLVIPKKHIEDLRTISEKDSALFTSLMESAQKAIREYANNSSFKVVINNGYEAGQRVFHLHAHILSGNIYDAV